MGTVLDTTVFIELERAMRGLPARDLLEAQCGLSRVLTPKHEIDPDGHTFSSSPTNNLMRKR